MPDRMFPIERISRGGADVVNAYKIQCGKCEGVGYKPHSANVRLNPKAAEQFFRNHGWTVGNGPRADICPTCNEKKHHLKVVKMETVKAEAPREMSREDRRIIFAKIDEIYIEGKGYSPPWTDAAVSRDLGVPRDWVARVRDELFGVEGSNQEFDDFLAKVAPIIAEVKNLFKAAHSQLEQAKALAVKIEELERIGRKIEKEISPVRKAV